MFPATLSSIAIAYRMPLLLGDKGTISTYFLSENDDL